MKVIKGFLKIIKIFLFAAMIFVVVIGAVTLLTKDETKS